MTTALIDADGLVLLAALAAEQAFQWDEDTYTLVADLAQVKMLFQESVTDLLYKVHAAVPITNHVLCLTDSGHDFRRDIWPDYKAKRSRKPLVYYELRKWVVETNPTSYLRDHLEADDILGILATNNTIVKGPKVIVSIDKDLKQIPGLLFNPDKDEEPTEVTQADAARWHLIQTLTGDQTDGYPGCPGIGAKRAPAIADGGWPAVVAAFEKAGLNETDALTQARVARILTSELYDFKNRKPILWTPTVQATAT
jgi:DNA polymerase-1